ncbi:MAG: hypothetical protein R6X19_11815 [Kiritimatiellia bacterium]
MKQKLLLLVAWVSAAAAAWAAPFQPTAAPAAAFWVAHVDAAGLKETEAGRALLADQQVAGSPQWAAFTTRFGLDPKRDLRGMTLYTMSTGRLDAVAVMEVEPEGAGRLKSRLGTDAFSAVAYGNRVIHRRRGEKNAPYCAWAGGTRFVAAMTLEKVQRALDLLDGKGASLRGVWPALTDRKDGAEAVLVLAGRGLGPEMQGVMPQLSLLRNATDLCLVVAEKAGRFRAGLSVTARDAPEAQRLEVTLVGLIEVARAMGDGAAGDLLQAVVVQGAGSTVRADGVWPTAEIIKMMRRSGSD